MARKKETLLKQFALDTFASFPEQLEETEDERKGIREGTKGLYGARIIDISRIKPDLTQPRKSFDKKGLKQLAVSIKEYGFIQPINVQYVESEDHFRVINGQRRYEAAKLAGILEIPCIIKNINKHLRLIHQLVENIQREDLPVLEEAEAIHTLLRTRRIENPHYSQREASRELGLPKTYVNEMLTLLKLPEDIKRDVRTSDAFPKSLLLLLIRQTNKKDIGEFYKQIRERKLTVRELETTLKKSKNRKGRPVYYQYIFEAPEKQFTLTIRFKKTRVGRSEIFSALSRTLNSLKQTTKLRGSRNKGSGLDS